LSGHFEAKKIAWRQTKDGLVLALAVHPDDMPKEMALSALNTRYMIAFSEIGDDEKPVTRTQAEHSEAAPKKPWSEYSRSQQAAILVNDQAFRDYFCGAGSGEAICDKNLKAHFHITSKRELDDPSNHNRWDEFVALYKLHEQRYAGSKR
jgi:hypothetical protein